MLIYVCVYVHTCKHCFVFKSQAICLGVLITSTVALSTIDLLYSGIDGDSEVATDRNRYRGVAGWLLLIGIAGMIVKVIMMIIWGLHSAKTSKYQFLVFSVLVCLAE